MLTGKSEFYIPWAFYEQRSMKEMPRRWYCLVDKRSLVTKQFVMSVNNFLFDCPEECMIPHAVSLLQLGLFAWYSIQPSFPVNHTGPIGKISVIINGNRTEWSGPIRSVFIRVINKIGRPRSGVRYV